MSARTERIDFNEGLNTLQLVPATASVGRRGKGAGFYCEVCNLTYKDSIQWIDHLNSKQHLYEIGETDGPRQSTLEDVQKRLKWLTERKRAQEKELDYDINARISARKQLIERQKKKKKDRKRQKREEKVEGGGQDDEMMAAMGFGGFGSTKK